ncbi:hypothetical protein FHS79_001641 [Polymorphobacter multimanifer]|uniref:Uncharacterized protein n=1 Tax=Polymorphobacter multimanifer TaxID=1070431 RepID=A0A841LCD4_9SPHN|nr:hypothetical protein [Polymorphobacter multimanifer]
MTDAAITTGDVVLTADALIRSTSGNVIVGTVSSDNAVTVRADAGTLTVGRDVAQPGRIESNGPVTLTSVTGDAIVRAGIDAGGGAVSITAGIDVVLGRTGSSATIEASSVAVSAARSIGSLGGVTLDSVATTLTAGSVAPAAGVRSISMAGTTITAGAGNVTLVQGAAFDGLAFANVTAASLLGAATVINGDVDIATLTTSNSGISLANTGRMAIGTASTSNAAGITLTAGNALVLGQASASNGPISLFGTTIDVTTAPLVNGLSLARSGSLAAGGALLVQSPGAVAIVGDVTTTGSFLTLDAGPTLDVAGAISSGGRVVALADEIALGDVTSRNDIVAVARMGDLTGADFRISSPDNDNSDAPVDASGNDIFDPVTGTAIGPLPGKRVVALAGGDLIGIDVFGADGATLAGDSVNLGDVSDPGLLDVTGRRIVGGTISANLGIILTATGENAGGPSPDGIYVGSLTSSNGDIILNSALDIVVDRGSAAPLGSISMAATRDLRLAEALGAGQLAVAAGNIVTLAGGRRVLVDARTTAGSTVTVAGGTDLMAMAPVSPIGVDMANVSAGSGVVLSSERNVLAGDIAGGAGSVTVTSNLGDVTLGNLTGSDLLVQTSPGTGGDVIIARVEGAGGTPGASTLLVSAAGAVSLVGPTRVSGTADITGTAVTTGAVSGSTIALEALLGNVETGALTGGVILLAGSDLLVNGEISGSALSGLATRDLTLNGDVVITAGVELQAQRSLQTADVDSGNGQLTAVAVAGDLNMGALSSASVVEIESTAGDATIDGVTALSLLMATGGSASIVGPALLIGTVDVQAGSNATTGALTAADIDIVASNGFTRTDTLAGGTIALNAGRGPGATGTEGDVTVAAIATGSNVLVRAGRDLAIAGATQVTGSVDFQAARNLTAAALESTGDGAVFALAEAGNLQMQSISGGVVTLGATLGDVTLAGAVNSASLDVMAGSMATLSAPVTVTGAAEVTAAEISTQTMTAGNILLSGVASVVTGALEADSITASASDGDVNLAGVANSGSLTVEASEAATLGPVAVAGAVTVGADSIATQMMSASFIELAGVSSVSTGALAAGNITVSASGGDVEIASVENSGNLTVTASDAATIGIVSVTDAVTVDADTITTQSVTAGTIALTGVSSVVTGALEADSITASASDGNVNIAGVADSGSLTVEASEAATLGPVSVAGAVRVGADSIATQMISASSIELAGVSSVSTGALEASNITVSASGGDVEIASVENSGNLTVMASDAATLGIVSVTDAVTVDADTITTQSVTAGTIALAGVSSVTTGALEADSITASASAGSVAIASVADSGSLTVTASDTVTSGAVTVTGAVVVGGGIISAQPITASTIELSGVSLVTTGALEAVSISALASAGSVNIASIANSGSLAVSASDSVTLGPVSVSGAVAVDADIIATQVIAADSIELAGVSSVSTGALEASNITVSASGGDVEIASVDNSGNLTVMASDAATIGIVSVTDAVIVEADTITTQSITAGSIALAGVSSVTTGALEADSITASASDGSVAIASVADSGSLTVTASDTATFGVVTINGALTVGAGSIITQDITAGTIALTGISSVTTGALAADSITASASDGSVAIASVADSGSLTVMASDTATLGAVTVTGAVVVGGGIISAQPITASTIELSGVSMVTTGALEAVSISALASAGSVNIASIANSGSLAVSASDSVTLGPVSVSGAVAVDADIIGTQVIAADSINLAGVSSVTTGGLEASNITVSASGGDVEIASVENSGNLAVMASDAATLGIVSVTDAVTVDADTITTQSVTAGTIALTGVSSVTTGALEAESITASASDGSVAIAGVADSGSLSVEASEAATLGPVSVAGAVRVGADSIATQMISASSIELAGVSSVSTGALEAGNITVSASGGDVEIASVDNSGNLTVMASDAATIGIVSVTDAVTVDADTITTQSVTAGTIALAGVSSVTTGALEADSITASASDGSVHIASVANSGSVAVSASDTATLGRVAVSDAIEIAADVIAAESMTGESIELTGVSSVTTADLQAGRIDARATAGTVNIAGIAQSGTVLVQAFGDVTLGGVGTSGAVTARAGQVGATAGRGDLFVGSVDSGAGAITLSATNGSIASGTLAGGVIQADATGASGDVLLQTILRSSQFAASAGRDLFLAGNATSIGSINLAAGRAMTVQAVAADGALAAMAGGVLVANDAISVARSIDLEAGNGLSTVDVDSRINSSVTARALAGDLEMGDVSGGVLTLAASAGNATIGGVPRAKSLALTASGTATLGTAVVTEAAEFSANVIVTQAITAGTVKLAGLTSVATGALQAETITASASAGSVDIATVADSGALAVTASEVATLGDVTVTGSVLVAADVVAAQTMTAGSIDLTGVSSVTTETLQAASIAASASAGSVVISNVQDSGELTVTASDVATLGNVAVSGAATVAADAIAAQLMTAGSIDLTGVSSVTTAALQAASITASASAGSVDIASVAESGSLTVMASDIVMLGNVTVTDAVTVTADTIGAQAMTAGTIELTGVSSVTTGALRGASIEVSASAGTVDLATVADSGSLTVTASDIVTLGNVAVTDAVTIAADTIGVQAMTAGTIDLAGVSSVTTGALQAAGIAVSASAGSVDIASIAESGTLAVTAADTAALGDVTVTGAVTVGADVIASEAMTAGSISMAGLTSVNTGGLRAGAIDVRATRGTVTIAGITGSNSVLAQASGDATLGNVISSGAVTLRAGQVGNVATSGNLRAGTVNATSARIDLRSTAGSIAAGTLAGGEIVAEATGITSDITLAGVDRSSRLALTSGRSILLNGSVRVAGTADLTTDRIDLVPAAELRTDGLLRLTANTAGGVVNVANGGMSLFDNADMPRVFAPSVQIDGKGRAVKIGTTDLFPNTVNVGVLTSNDIDVTGVLTFRSTGSAARRTLTLGGLAVADSGSATSNEGLANAARSVAVRVVEAAGATAGGGQIVADGSAVRLNGRYLAVGLRTQFLDTLLTDSPPDPATVRRSFTEQPTSRFYIANPPFQPPRYNVLTAERLVVRVEQWGLLQNTDTSAQPGGGVRLGSVQLLNGGAVQGGPVVGFFGSLGGQEGIAAALRVTIDQLGGISPNNVRINGCVALTTAGCIVTGLPLPLVQLNDPGQALLIRSTPDLVLPLDLISGTTNEALWRDDELEPVVTPVPAATTPADGARP